MGEFEAWLEKRLTDLGTDASVFGPYITSILEGEESQEDKDEGVLEILSDIITEETQIKSLLKEIKERWQQLTQQRDDVTASKDSKQMHSAKLDINDQMHKIMEEKLSNFAIAKKEPTAEEKRLKAAILASYAEVEDGEEEDSDSDGGGDGLGSNANVEAVAKAQAEWKESQRQAAMAKKEKDKEDRANQKLQAEERKKKAQEKTAKGERRSGR